MSQWQSGSELMQDLDLKEIELFHHVKKGLQPYNQSGKPIPPPPIRDKITELPRLKKRRDELTGEIDFTDPRPIIQYRRSKEMKRWQNEIKILENKIEPMDAELSQQHVFSWENYDLPDSEKESSKILELLKNALFKRTNVQPFKIKNLSNSGDIKIMEIIESARPELKKVYGAVKKVGFSARKTNNENDWQRAALQCFQQNRNQFSILTEEDLNDIIIFSFTVGQEKRDFIGRLLKKIIERNGLGSIGGQRLFTIYQSTNRLTTD